MPIFKIQEVRREYEKMNEITTKRGSAKSSRDYNTEKEKKIVLCVERKKAASPVGEM